MLLGRCKLNTIEILISKFLINSYISHDEFVSVKNSLGEHNKMKKEIKTLKVLWNILCKSNGNLFCQI